MINNKIEIGKKEGCWTLGAGKKSKNFFVQIGEDGIRVLTGQKRETDLYLTNQQIESFLNHFSTNGWFLLGNNIADLKDDSLGEYFKNTLKRSAKFASHFAAILVIKGRLEHRYGKYNAVELKVVK